VIGVDTDRQGSIPLFKIPKEKIITIATALDLAYADIIICQNNKKWDAPDRQCPPAWFETLLIVSHLAPVLKY
jgi:hypothetical protein